MGDKRKKGGKGRNKTINRGGNEWLRATSSCKF